MTQIYQALHGYIFDVDRIPLAIAALLLCSVVGMITGPLRGNANPFVWGLWDIFLGRIGDRLNNTKRSKADLIFRGFLLTAFAVLVLAFLSKIIQAYLPFYNHFSIAEILILSLCLTSGAIWFSLLRLYFSAEKERVEEGTYYAMARTTRIDLNSTDTFGLNRTALSLAARSFDKGLVAPILWYIIGGLPLALVHASLSALAWRFGQDGFTKGFGSAAMVLEKLLGVVPSVFAGFLITMASALTPTAGILKSLHSWMVRENTALYEQGGAPLTSMAWGLGISLGGPVRDLRGSTLKNGWTGPENASAKLDHQHLKRGLYINLMAHILFLVSLLGAYLWGASAFASFPLDFLSRLGLSSASY